MTGSHNEAEQFYLNNVSPIQVSFNLTRMDRKLDLLDHDCPWLPLQEV